MKTTAFNQSVIQGTWVNSKKKPFDDPRVRRALHLAFDRPTLIEVVKDVTPMQVGGFIYPFSDFATPKETLFKRIGYQSDPAAGDQGSEALMAAAGHPNGMNGLDFLVRDVPSFKLWAQAIQAMLQEALNVQCNLRTTVESVWFDDTANGHFDLAIGAIVSTLLDPSDYFNAWYRTGGPQNYSIVAQREIRRAGRSDRPRGRSRPSATNWSARPRRSWSRTRRCCRSPGNRSTTSGTTT